LLVVGYVALYKKERQSLVHSIVSKYIEGDAYVGIVSIEQLLLPDNHVIHAIVYKLGSL